VGVQVKFFCNYQKFVEKETKQKTETESINARKGNAKVKYLHSRTKETRKEETNSHIKPSVYQCLSRNK
jgi:hypothetical protein